jgi:hypothetical protein
MVPWSPTSSWFAADSDQTDLRRLVLIVRTSPTIWGRVIGTGGVRYRSTAELLRLVQLRSIVLEVHRRVCSAARCPGTGSAALGGRGSVRTARRRRGVAGGPTLGRKLPTSICCEPPRWRLQPVCTDIRAAGRDARGPAIRSSPINFVRRGPCCLAHPGRPRSIDAA